MPNVPAPAVRAARCGSTLANLGARDALVVAIVPLLDVVGDLDAGGALDARARVVAVGLPRQDAVWQAEVEQLKRALGTLAGRYIAVPKKEGG